MKTVITTLQYIVDNPAANPHNVRSMVRDVLIEIKDFISKDDAFHESVDRRLEGIQTNAEKREARIKELESALRLLIIDCTSDLQSTVCVPDKDVRNAARRILTKGN